MICSCLLTEVEEGLKRNFELDLHIPTAYGISKSAQPIVAPPRTAAVSRMLLFYFNRRFFCGQGQIEDPLQYMLFPS